MDTILEIQGLCKRYDGFCLDHLDLSLPGGAILGLIGENGAGKSTAIKLILNLIHRDAGRVTILGKDGIRDEVTIKEQVGVVFEDSCFHEVLKAGQVSRFMRGIYRNWDDGLFWSYCERFGVPRDKYIKEFSRGMKMKLSIAAALAHRPKLLLLDEAVSGLDPVVRNEILDLFLEFIQDEDHAILLSSHITSDLDRVADYIAFLHEGKLVFCESKDELAETYGILRCGSEAFAKMDRTDIVRVVRREFGVEALVTNRQAVRRRHPDKVVDRASLEDIMLLYIRGEGL